MMLAGANCSAAREGAVQDLKFRNALYIEPPPIRKLAAARSPYLIGEQPDVSVLHSVIMRLKDAVSARVAKPDQASVADCSSEQLIDGIWQSFPLYSMTPEWPNK
jgi:hypothetical protein